MPSRRTVHQAIQSFSVPTEAVCIGAAPQAADLLFSFPVRLSHGHVFAVQTLILLLGSAVSIYGVQQSASGNLAVSFEIDGSPRNGFNISGSGNNDIALANLPLLSATGLASGDHEVTVTLAEVSGDQIFELDYIVYEPIYGESKDTGTSSSFDQDRLHQDHHPQQEQQHRQKTGALRVTPVSSSAPCWRLLSHLLYCPLLHIGGGSEDIAQAVILRSMARKKRFNTRSASMLFHFVFNMLIFKFPS